MIHPTTGRYQMIDPTYIATALDDGMLVMHGTEDDVAEVAGRIRLGAAERSRRAARRKMQRSSRRRNR